MPRSPSKPINERPWVGSTRDLDAPAAGRCRSPARPPDLPAARVGGCGRGRRASGTGPGRGGHRRPVLPARRQRRDRRAAVPHRRLVPIRRRAAARRDPDPAARHPGPGVLQPRLPAAGRPGHRGRPPCGLRPGDPAPRARHHAEDRAEGGGERARGGRVRRSARALRLPRREQLAGERPRGRGHEPAAHGALVVPVQRPPARQGPGRHHDHGAARQAGRRQRPPGLAGPAPAGPGGVPLGRRRADGAVPRVLRRGRASRSRAGRRTACPGWWPCPSGWRRRCGGTGWS